VSPVAPASEAETLWRLARQLERRVAELERRDDLDPLREELRGLARDVAALRDDLLGLLKDDRASLVEVLVHGTPPAASPPAPGTSIGPPRAVRAHLRAWVGWSMVALAGATATALTAAILALAKGCGG
jgi:hypothetical protein